jgi:hypothetical protein
MNYNSKQTSLIIAFLLSIKTVHIKILAHTLISKLEVYHSESKYEGNNQSNL